MRRAAAIVLVMGLACGEDAPRVLPAVSELPERAELPEARVSFFDGRTISSAADWESVRRPELELLFRHYVYGFVPAPVTPAAEVEAEAELAGVRYRGVRLSLGAGPPIRLALFLPAGVERPPVFLVLNKCGNHSLLADDAVIPSAAWVDPACPSGRGGHAALFPVAALAARGYALATFHESDVDPDDQSDERFADGVHPHFDAGAIPTRWGRIAAWAWGLSRAVDHLVTEPAVDGARIIVTGHSRRGKAALLAGAYDRRIAAVIPHQSGTAGAALSRGNTGEPVDIINRSFPHWFNEIFPEFGEREARLPIDQHLLLALVAPRPLLVTDGAGDAHASPSGARRAVEAADEVYGLLGSEGMTSGRLAWHERPGGHSLGLEDWMVFMQFADEHVGPAR